jgi:hypothetical protein
MMRATLPSGAAPHPKSRLRRRLFLLLITLLAVGVILFQWSILRSGGRIEFGRSSIVPSVPPILAPALVADGVTLVDFRRHGQSQSFEGLVRIARYKIVMQLSTKETALEPDSLAYALFDAQGFLLSRGTVRSAVRLAPGETGDFEIVDANVHEAFQAVIDRRE